MMSFTWPAAQSLLSRKTSPSEQGQLQGAINSLRGIAGLVGPGFFTYIFSRSISSGIHIPGTPFYTAATMLVIALLLTQRVTRPTSSRRLTHQFNEVCYLGCPSQEYCHAAETL